MEKAILIKALKLSHIPRWVIVDLRRPQTVSDHTYRTQILSLHINQKLGLNIDEGKLALKVLFHDIEEAETGDLPSPYKGSKFKIKPSEDILENVLRLADTIEATIWLVRYAVNPGRVRRFLESKISALETELSEFSGVSVNTITELTSNIIDAGKNHD